MNFRLILAVAVLTLTAATANAALVFTVTGFNLTTESSDLSAVSNGDLIELSVDIANTNGDQIAALEAGVWNLVEPGAALDFVSGEAAGKVLTTALDIGTGFLYQNGIENQTAGTAGEPDSFGNATPVTLSIDDVIESGETLKWFGGLSTASPSPSEDGSTDLGVGGQTGLGNPHAVLVFEFIGSGSTTVTIGAGGPGLGSVISGTGSDVTDQVTNANIEVPEPTSMFASMAALTTVCCVVGIRRRVA